MDISLTWLIAGFILIIAELMTGTFYLLVLGIAALVGAGVWQAIGAAIVAVAGVIWVNQYKKKMAPKRMQGLDFGQPAAFDSWVNKSAGHARVKYRDALWDAQIAGDASGEPGEIFYITSVDGSTLKVSKTRPA
jgi:membrane protein implicated in regulation of membrane protease activity